MKMITHFGLSLSLLLPFPHFAISQNNIPKIESSDTAKVKIGVPLGDLLDQVTHDPQLARQAGQQISADACAPATGLLQIARDDKAESNIFMEAAVRSSLADLGYFLIKPLSELGAPNTDMGQLQYIHSLWVSIDLARESIAETINSLLDDKRTISTKLRVRDYAYLAMRQLLTTKAGTTPDEKTFLKISQKKRDIEIDRYQKSSQWQSMLENAPLPFSAITPPLSPQAVLITESVHKREDSLSFLRLIAQEKSSQKAVQKSEDFETRVLIDSLKGLRALVALSRGQDAHLATSARLVMEQLSDLMLRPLLEAGPPSSAEDRQTYLADLIRAEKVLYNQAKAALLKTLHDKRQIPQYESSSREPIKMPKPEKAEEPRRVCDEAYLALSTMQHLGHLFHNEGESYEIKVKFLQSSTRLKDLLISRGIRTGKWDGPTEKEFIKDHRMLEKQWEEATKK